MAVEAIEYHDLLRELLWAYGPCGQEDAVREICLRELSPNADQVWVDPAGNVVALVRGNDGYPILGGAVLRRARRVIEAVMLPVPADLAAGIRADILSPGDRAAIAAPFEAMFTPGEQDPWRFDDSRYEQRRFDLVTSCLGRPRYRRILEIGCATRQLAHRLVARADEVTAIDASAAALQVARARASQVHWVHGTTPGDLPAGEFDAIIISEVGYFLDGADLLATLRAARRQLRDGGEIVLAHWQGPVHDTPLDGASVHAQAAAVLDLPLRARYADADLLIEVWGAPISVHALERATR